MPGKLLRSFSMPKFPTISRSTLSRAFLPAQLKCVFEDNVSSIPDFNGKYRHRSDRSSSLSHTDSLADKHPCTLSHVQGHACMWLRTERRKRRDAKWKEKYFLLKDSFLFYYNLKERDNFEQCKVMNLRPEGVIPLGGCIQISGCRAYGRKFAISISYEDTQTTKSAIILACIDEAQQDLWVKKLREASCITVNSTELGEIMIKELENQGLRLNEEKQRYIDLLHTEANALRSEIDRNEELERVRIELEFEKTKLEKTTKELRSELNIIKEELQKTLDYKLELETEKNELCAKTEQLQDIMEELAIEKLEIETILSAQEREKEELSIENRNLSATTQSLQDELNEIEGRTAALLEQQSHLESKLKENITKTLILEEEKDYYSGQAKELLDSLNDLATQKEMTEAELKDEIIARITAEKRLKAAEKALEHLELALKLSGPGISADLKDQIIPDVRKLKDFFEACAEEARLDANRPLIMKNAVYARKSFLKKCKERLRSSLRRSLPLSTAQTDKTSMKKGHCVQPTRLFIRSIDSDDESFAQKSQQQIFL